MARKAQDAAIGQLIDTLERQAVKRGRRFVKVNPAYTTQDCSNCGARAKHRLGLQDRVYKCECCGFVLDRDKNSAINMLIGAGFIPGPIGTLSRSDAAVHCCAVFMKAKTPGLSRGRTQLILSQARLPVPPQGEFDWYISIIYHASVVRYIACVREDHCSIGAMCGITTSNNFW